MINDFHITLVSIKGQSEVCILFTLVPQELTKLIQHKPPWYRIFIDKIVLIDEHINKLNSKLELWRKVLEITILSRTAIGYI